MHKPLLQCAPIGMGGFAANHHAALRTLEEEGLCRVIAACDPKHGEFPDFRRRFAFEERGIPVYSDYRDMLAAHRAELDFATVPTPIAWHRPMHRDCVEEGIACYLEKPPTLDWNELTEMLQTEERARMQTMVGFVHIVEEPRRRLKQRLLNGEFGKLQRLGLNGLSPRNTAYYQRAPWAGRLMLGDNLILDSCIGNALAHFVHNLLFWCGEAEVLCWGSISAIEAEFYRAHDIENFDTCFARGRTGNDVEVRVAASHTGTREQVFEWLECEKAFIRYESGRTLDYEITWRDGRTERVHQPQVPLLLENLRAYLGYLRGEVDRPLIRLDDTQSFVHLNGLLYVAAGEIHAIPSQFVGQSAGSPSEGKWITVEGLDAAFEALSATGRFPGEGTAAWGRPGGSAVETDIVFLPATARAMQEAGPLAVV